MNDLTRRELLASFLGLPAAAVIAGCGAGGGSLPLEGEIVGASHGIGHALRDGLRPRPAEDAWQRVGAVIVGGGVAGLAAAWRLALAGFEDFLLLELEPAPGGTSRSGTAAVAPYPWGAHYVPAPLKENRPLVALLDEMGVLEGRDAEGEPLVAEQWLCRDPEERLFFEGTWHEGLYPRDSATQQDLAELKAFEAEVERWVAWRDGRGRRAFAIPAAHCSDDAEVTALDALSMADWLGRQAWKSARLRWLIDYSCRDDYGLTIEQTSAWAGLFYFASRIRKPGEKPRPLVTWPEGDGRLVAHLYDKVSDKVRLGMAVSEIVPGADPAFSAQGGVEIVAVSHDQTEILGVRAKQVIFAAPHFLAPRLIRGFDERAADAAEFQYGAWLVANLFLRDRPAKNGFALAWDNVLHDSPSLGYVVATHQRLLDYGPTIFTYYHPLCDDDPQTARQRLLGLSWTDCAEIVLSDLERAHPDIRQLTRRLDVMRWGHAMVRPRPGFIWGRARREAARPFRGIHFAHTDLSGVALCEEALYHGVRAAEEILAARQWKFESML